MRILSYNNDPRAENLNAYMERLSAIFALVVTMQIAEAGSATWDLNPTSNDWATAANWTPQTVPYGVSDVATFGSSSVTEIAVGDSPNGIDSLNIVGDLVFSGGADSYTITVTPVYDVVFASILEFHGEGIINNSGTVQNLVTAHSGTTKASGEIYFMEASSAGDDVVITNQGGDSPTGDGYDGGFTDFGYNSGDTASAGRATIINEGGLLDGTLGGSCEIVSSAGAESATIINNAGEVAGGGAGWTLVRTLGNIGSSTFIANPASVPDAEGGWAEYDVGTTAGAKFIANGAAVANAQAGQIYVYGWGAEGYAIFTGNGGNGSGAQGGLIDVFGMPLLSEQTVVIARSGSNGGLGGTILLERDAEVELPQFRVFGNGTLDLINATGTTAIGSLSGDGVVLLAGNNLSVGTNNLNTAFSGTIQESGAFIKAGTSTLTLSGANTYTGATTVTAGTLRINNSTGSGTGTGLVRVQAGNLGGKGTIAGAVTIGTGSGTGAVLALSAGVGQLAVLTLQRSLRFKADGSYSYRLNTNNARADQVIAKGVTIESGAQFTFQSLGNRRLPTGTIFTVISNTSANPIAGTFANLPDGSIFAAGRNNYQASYEGGDGNDLTLAVAP
jgi:autotransporter-associated beta strand protein